MIELKLIFALIGTGLGLAAFAPYFFDIFRKKTRPHIYTWFIWLLTQGIAVVALLKGGGGFGALELAVGTFFIFLIVLLSFHYGTKDITKTDIVVLIAALCAIGAWTLLHQPVLSVAMVSAIDFVGYIPTWRKTFKEPYSETVWTWSLFALANIFGLLALREFNFLTVTYLITITAANIVVIVICLLRRPIYSHQKV